MALPGLSPRVRGNQPPTRNRGVGGRSIPACAGEPKIGYKSDREKSVYPRVCGGTIFSPSKSPPRAGLSPRVRGNRHKPRPAAPRRGSIPACAGEPGANNVPLPRDPVYPRVCGGTRRNGCDSVRRNGLSPRVRGNPQVPQGHIGGSRSIPACAGEPTSSTGRPRAARVYPRVCGGTASADESSVSAYGLSPRVRGNHDATPTRTRRERSIPACAGEPPAPSRRASAGRVYPRVCGGTFVIPVS